MKITLDQLKSQALSAGDQDKLNKLQQAGRLNARQRIQQLCDPGSFREIDQLVRHDCNDFSMGSRRPLTDGVITGAAHIQGRPVFIFSQDATIFGGSLSKQHANKICKIMDLAMDNGRPIIGINDSGGARIQEGVRSLGGYADIFLRNTMASGSVPQLSLIMGACAGGAVYSPAITDFTLMVDQQSYMFVTGPDVIATVTHEQVSKEELGGAMAHNQKSGVAHFCATNETQLLELTRALLSYLPSNYKEQAPMAANRDPIDRNCDNLKDLIPQQSNKPYDMHALIESVVDMGQFLEVQAHFAKNMIVGFARLGGFSVGVVANQPTVLAGCLDIDASTKAARFVRFCDCFNIPLVTLVDVPGFLPGVSQEHHGIIRHGAKLLYAFAEATVPKITIITRKAYGGAYDVMSSKHLRGDINLAYPQAEIAVMGAEGAVQILHREQLKQADNAQKQALIEQYRDTFLNPLIAAELGFIDDIIHPESTRTHLCYWLEQLKNKRLRSPNKKHGNIPL